MATKSRRGSSTNFATTNENVATAKELESKTDSFGYMLEMKLTEKYAEFEHRANAVLSLTSRAEVMWALVIDTARYYSIPKEEVNLEVIRCRLILSQGPQIFEDCYCEWCAGTPETGEQDRRLMGKKPGCIRKYLKDSQTPLYF